MFFFKNRMRKESYKAVYSVSIDTNSEYHSFTSNNRWPPCLIPGGDYWFGKEKERATYDELKELAIRIINEELLNECEQFDIPVLDIKVKSIYEGSIELFFTVLFGVVAGVAAIKDLHDSIEFLRTLAEKKLLKRFRDKYGDYFRIDVKRHIPRDTRFYDDFDYLQKQRACSIHQFKNDERPKRDGFFYYLLISNVVLLAILIALIASAVMKVYF
ncbi:MAG: hypothetical protein FWF10_06560 [Clostridiales bacterium]|nr:hypothetical protein [Clostridiales bacterium]